MRFAVHGSDGRKLVIDAVDWMMAISGAIKTWGLEVSGWAASPAPGGVMEVVDARSGASWTVAPHGSEIPLWATPKAGVPREVRPNQDDPSLRAPDHRTILNLEDEAKGVPPDLPVRLAALRQASDADEAWKRAVDLLDELLPCEALSALRADPDALTFVLAFGPGSNELIGRTVPYGAGIAGAAMDLGATVRVDDVSVDHRHFHAFDDEIGFQTRAILATPVRRGERFFGVLEVLNPPGAFAPWHVEVAEAVGLALGATLDQARPPDA